MAIQEPSSSGRRSQTAAPITQPLPKPIVHAVAIPRSARKPRQWGRALLQRLGFSEHLAHTLAGYIAGVVGVALTTLAIGGITTVTHVETLSLLYLLVVLWLAVAFGRGPAIIASFLAFLAYDFFFVPPVHRLTVDDPAQWISLLALLATALVIGQLTATVQEHVHAARVSQQHMARLYTLAQLISGATDEQQLLQALAQRVAQVFASSGLLAAGLLLPDAARNLTLRAAEPAESQALGALQLDTREQAAMAKWALQHGAPVGINVPAPTKQAPYKVFYFPLWSGHRVVGVLSIAGTEQIRSLATRLPVLPSGSVSDKSAALPDPQTNLFAAFCGQIALAVERVGLQQQAIHAEALRESDRLKNVLLGSVTHDLRTPLASIKASTTSLLEPGMTWRAEDCREFIEAIDTSVDRLSHLVNNVLDLSRLEAGAARPEKDWYLIGEVISTALSQLEQAGQSRGRQIEVDAPETLPLVSIDHSQIERVLINLLENALKYSPPESVVQVQARMVGLPPELEVRISDQGIGIAADELHAIFDKFYRGQQPALPWAKDHAPKGAGLGLTICSSIVQAHGGHIWAESRPGEGATFIFTLPVSTDGPQGRLPELASPEQEPAPAPAESGALK